MNSALIFVRVLGFSALAIFVAMAAVLQLKIAPNVSFLPQAEFFAYPDSALVQFSEELRSQDLEGLYRSLLLIVDFIFIVIFGLWVMLVHMVRSAVSWRFLGVVLAVLFMALDFSEDMMIAVRMGFAGQGSLDPAALTAEVSAVHYVTLAKTAVFMLCMLSAFIATRKRG